MPHSVPVAKLMILPREWPQLRAETDVSTAIKILRIISEEHKLEHGHSTPLVMDENFQLLGFVHLTDSTQERETLVRKKRPTVRSQ